MSNLINKSILPKLVSTLRAEFHINPASQNNDPLDWTLSWQNYLLPGTLSHLLETEFFPKWIFILWSWLSSPSVSHDEVSRWYMAWKSYFPPQVLKLPGIVNGFKVGLDLMNKSLSLPKGHSLGPVPVIIPHALSGVGMEEVAKATAIGAKKNLAGLPELLRKKETESSFRDLLEQAAAAYNLILIPASSTRNYNVSGKPVYRMTDSEHLGQSSVGVLLYIDDGVVFVNEGGREGKGMDEKSWTPISIDALIEKAKERLSLKKK